MNNPVKIKEIADEIEAMSRLKKDKKKKKKSKHRSRSRSDSKKRKKSHNEDKEDRKKSKDGKKDDKKSKKHRKYSSDSSRSESPNRRSRDRKKKDKDKEGSVSTGTDEDKFFNDYVRKRLGPLVEFDEESLRLRFTANKRFKTNDKKPITEEEREKMVSEMKKNAELHEQTKMAKYNKNLAEENQPFSKASTGGYLQQMHKDAMAEGGRNNLEDNLNRGRFFHEKRIDKD